MFVFLQILDCRTTYLLVDPDESIELLHNKIYMKVGVPEEYQCLIYAGQELMNGYSVADYKIEEDARIHMCFHEGLRICIQNHRKLADVTVIKRALGLDPIDTEEREKEEKEKYKLRRDDRVDDFFKDLDKTAIMVRITVHENVNSNENDFNDTDKASDRNDNVKVNGGTEDYVSRTIVVRLLPN